MKDKCIICYCETIYNKEEHINQRIGYIEGAGQLCLECWDKIYGITYKKEYDKNNNLCY